MQGIFGYLSRNISKENTKDIINAVRNENYSIKESILTRLCVLGSLDIKSTKIKEITKKSKDKISIITSGEIYNDDGSGLERSILNLYENGDLDLLKNLNGSFVAAIYDDAKEKLILVNDRYGSIKMYYYYDKDHFCFAPKIKPLLKLGAKKTLRRDGIIDFFLFRHLLGDKTFFEHIHQLPPASILEVSINDMKLTRYWNYKYFGDYAKQSEEELRDELGQLWQKAIERRIEKDEKIIIPLGGGLDSRAILAAALKCTPKKNIITFTFGEKESYDYTIGKMVAEKAGVKNISLIVEKKDFEQQYSLSMDDIEGMIEATPYFAIKGYSSIKKHGNKLFTGFMGGELMGPLIFSKFFNKKPKSKKTHIETCQALFNHHSLYTVKDIKLLLNPTYFNTDNIEYSFKETVKDITTISENDLPNYCAMWMYMHENNNYSSFCVLRNKNLFNYYLPFLDNDLVDFMLKTPPSLRCNKKLYKSMLIKNYPDLFTLPVKNMLGLKLDAHKNIFFFQIAILFLKRRLNRISSMIMRKNIFFDETNNYINYDDLLRTNKEYQEYIRGMLKKVKEREYFNKDYVEEIWRLHMQGKKNFAMLFGLLVTFELFLEEFADNYMKN